VDGAAQIDGYARRPIGTPQPDPMPLFNGSPIGLGMRPLVNREALSAFAPLTIYFKEGKRPLQPFVLGFA
jgi:hypothetical protein